MTLPPRDVAKNWRDVPAGLNITQVVRDTDILARCDMGDGVSDRVAH